MIDIHCHILPGLDDGAADLEAAVAMARLAAADGVAAIVATPHVFDGEYETPRRAAEEGLATLRAALAAAAVPVELHLGCDCRLDPRLFDERRAPEAPTIAGGRYLLIELPHELVPPRFEDSIFRLRARGIAPVLTHPERNRELQRRGGLERLETWIERGLLAQITGDSFTGGFGGAARAFAEAALARGACHFVASDAHSPDWRPPRLGVARAAVERLAGPETAERLFVENPGRAIRDEPIEARRRR